jgi:hypothetical protein
MKNAIYAFLATVAGSLALAASAKVGYRGHTYTAPARSKTFAP